MKLNLGMIIFNLFYWMKVLKYIVVGLLDGVIVHEKDAVT